MNRPKTDNPRSAQLAFRVSPDVRAAIDKAASADSRTMSAWIELALTERLQRDGYLSKPRGKK